MYRVLRSQDPAAKISSISSPGGLETEISWRLKFLLSSSSASHPSG